LRKEGVGAGGREEKNLNATRAFYILQQFDLRGGFFMLRTCFCAIEMWCFLKVVCQRHIALTGAAMGYRAWGKEED
jgi:hypothetical protein